MRTPCASRAQIYVVAMIPRSALLASLLRVLVACLALGIVCGVPTRAMARADVVTWGVCSHVVATGEQREAEQEHDGISPGPARTTAVRRAVHAIPARAHPTVVRSRLYLLYGTLLR